MSGGFDFTEYLQEEVKIELSKIEIFLLVMALCFAFENKKIKNSWMVPMLQPLGKKLVNLLKIDGIIPLDDDVKLEWSRKGIL